MGPRGLSGYLSRSGLGLVKGRIADLSGGKLVVDALNCVYGLARKHGTEVPFHFQNLCKLLRGNDVRVLMLFDGQPNKQQRRVRSIRYAQRQKREQALAALSGSRQYHTAADKLRWQLATPALGDVAEVETIASGHGFCVRTVEGEADKECVKIASANDAVVFSTDTDLLVHGAPLVIHEICVEHGTYSAWRLSDILQGLGITLVQFQRACALVGGDGDKALDRIDNVLYKTKRCSCCIIDSYEAKTGNQLDWVRKKAEDYAI